MINKKRSYTCGKCSNMIIADVAMGGTIPHIIECVNPNCDHVMMNNFSSTWDMGEPGYHLVRDDSKPTDKLELQKIKVTP